MPFDAGPNRFHAGPNRLDAPPNRLGAPPNRFDAATLPIAVAPLVIAAALLAACADPEEGSPRIGQVTIERIDTLVTTASALIGHPTDIVVAPDGEVYVADRESDFVYRLSPEGQLLSSIGGAGSGPGELDGPTAVGAGPDAVWVVDQGNGRLQTLSREGEYVATRPLPPEIQVNRGTVGPEGSVVLGTMGADSSLVLRVAGSGESRRLGLPVVPPPRAFDMSAIKAHIADGGIPDEFRNMVLAAEDATGAVWVALQSEAEVRRYDARGTLLWTLSIESPALDPILDEFFRSNVEEDAPFVINPLRYFADIGLAGDEAWLLLNAPVDRPAAILRVSVDGVQTGSIEVPAAAGARALAVDAERGWLYLGVPRDAQVVAARSPLIG